MPRGHNYAGAALATPGKATSGFNRNDLSGFVELAPPGGQRISPPASSHSKVRDHPRTSRRPGIAAGLRFLTPDSWLRLCSAEEPVCKGERWAAAAAAARDVRTAPWAALALMCVCRLLPPHNERRADRPATALILSPMSSALTYRVELPAYEALWEL